ncbi:hypothetical protein B0T22DRAFT_94743 [Podospora appendiculata]|uniref:Uncharacterized protein n=1 Tax=Podospora appendiculata TaxID=314037 RepID=A0AAE0XKM5_9PEZI|nr:hypothetical protein B0T22DRAFT_94743 [Podospora appendiculata]
MPSVAQEAPAMVPSPGKKRRRDDNEPDNHNNTIIHPLYALLPLSSKPTYITANCKPSSSPHPSLYHRAATADNGILFDPRQHHHHQHHHSPPTRKVLPLPSSKRQRTSTDRDEGGMRSRSHSPTGAYRRTSSLPLAATTATTTITLPREEETARERSAPARNTAPANLMSRCHICFRKPSRKSDLDSFADCQGCGQRTCYVCIRECLGSWPHLSNGMLRDRRKSDLPSPTVSLPNEESFTMLDADTEHDLLGKGERPPTDRDHHPRDSHPPLDPSGWASGGHRQMICSACCVEKGQDGDAVCLGCLPFFEG